MKKPIWIFALALVIVVLIVEYDLSKRMVNRATKNGTLGLSGHFINEEIKKQVKPVNTQDLIAAEDSVKKQAVKNNSESSIDAANLFESQFIKEAQKVSQLQNDPKKIDQEMDQLAKKMTDKDIEMLAITLSRHRLDGDMRAMAVELLTRNQTENAMKVLNDFIQEPTESKNSGAGWSRDNEFESVLKAQAIEGLGGFPQKETALNYLKNLEKHVQESFLKDRLVRTQESIKGKASSVEKQDEEALRKLVE